VGHICYSIERRKLVLVGSIPISKHFSKSYVFVKLCVSLVGNGTLVSYHYITSDSYELFDSW